MYTGPIPDASVYGTWLEQIEVSSADDGQLVDLSVADEYRLKVRDPINKIVEIQLTMSNGDITLPSIGILQWRAEAKQMGTLSTKLYEVVLTAENVDGSVLVLILGNIAIVE